MTNIRKDARFMRNTGVVLLVLTILAFAPRYFYPLLGGTYQSPSLWMHPHAIFAFLWTLIFIIQPSLVLQKKSNWHKRLGYVAILIAISNIVSGIALQFAFFPANKEDFSNIIGGGFRLFHSVPAFVVFFVAAIVVRKRTDWHLRFMYQTAIAAIATILGRIYLFYGQFSENAIAALIPAGNLGFVLLLPVYDYLQYRKVHPASWIGVAAFFAFQALSTPIVMSNFWTKYATGG